MREKISYNVNLAFHLTDKERERINIILTKGTSPVRVFKRALILRHFDEGQTSPDIAFFVGLTAESVRRIGWNYQRGGLDRAL